MNARLALVKGEDSQMLLSWGNFQFEISTLAYDSLRTSASYPWAKVERMGNRPQLQAMGKDHRTMSISGIVFPTYNDVGAGLVEALRELAAKMKPQILVSGDGSNLGKWCILSIDEDDSFFFENGVPRKQSFSIEMERFGIDE